MFGCILALQRQRQYFIGKQFDILTDHAPNQYILFQQKVSRRQVHWVEILAEYAANFIYKPGCIHCAPDALSRIPALNLIGKSYSLLEAVRQAQKTSTDQEFLQIKYSADNPTSEFFINQGLIVKLMLDSSPIVSPGDADQLKRIILTELHTSPFGGHLGYR